MLLLTVELRLARVEMLAWLARVPSMKTELLAEALTEEGDRGRSILGIVMFMEVVWSGWLYLANILLLPRRVPLKGRRRKCRKVRFV